MRISISTKVFLGFIVVLLSFGFSSVYNVLRTSEIRDSVSLVREGIVPFEKETNRISDELSKFKKLLMQRRPRKKMLEKVEEYLSNQGQSLFSDLKGLESRVGMVATQANKLNMGGNRLFQIQKIILTIRKGYTFALRSKGGPNQVYMGDDSSHLEGYLENEKVFTLISNSFTQAVRDDDEEGAVEAYNELRTVVSEFLRRTTELNRLISSHILEINEEARKNESRLVRDVIFTSTVALIISILVMFLTHQGIRRIRFLIQGVRSISDGKYEFPVSIRGADEIAQLASEFHKMGNSLRERDTQLAAQSSALIRSERFATIGKVSSLITHEIRNPLSSIGLNAELLEEEISAFEGCDITESRQLLRAIGSEVDRLRDVTEEYLQFARLPKPDLEQTSLQELVESLVRFVGPELEQKKISITVTSEECSLVLMDSNQIRQALLNLIRNATEAIGEQGGKILLHLKNHENGMSMIRIEDSGPGVPFEVQPHIFEAFYSTKPSGTGMGLSLVQQIVAEHGGEVRCLRSAVLGGAKFVVFLPVA